MSTLTPERISIELTNYCTKGCPFCYNASTKEGATFWQVDELEEFVRSCVSYGTKAVSFGGGEPLEFDGLFELLTRLRGVLFRSVTTNGLKLNPEIEKQLIKSSPDKVHVSIHFPHIEKEVIRVRDQVLRLEELGIRSGVNLLVEKHRLDDAQQATQILLDAGIGHDRIVFLPLKSVSPEKMTTCSDILKVTNGAQFQSMTCLKECGISPRFCSVSWDKKIAWCSYTSERRALKTLDAKGVLNALTDLGIEFCGTHSRINVDYPAAHSTDSIWFGVDEDDEVAAFYTNENGAVPKILDKPGKGAATPGDEVYQCFPGKGVIRIPTDGSALADLCNKDELHKLRLPDTERAEENIDALQDLVIQYTDPKHVVQNLSEQQQGFLFAGPHNVVFYKDIYRHALQETLHAEGISGCAFGDNLIPIEEHAKAQGLTLSQYIQCESVLKDGSSKHYLGGKRSWFAKYFGLHIYEADWSPNYYKALYRPPGPIKYYDLYESSFNKIEFIELPGVRFSQTSALQPMALVPCLGPFDFTGVDGSIINNQIFENGILLDNLGNPITNATMQQIAIRAVGEVPSDLSRPAIKSYPNLYYDHIECLECRATVLNLEKHLKEDHYRKDPESYRARWNLPEDYPMLPVKQLRKKWWKF